MNCIMSSRDLQFPVGSVQWGSPKGIHTTGEGKEHGSLVAEPDSSKKNDDNGIPTVPQGQEDGLVGKVLAIQERRPEFRSPAST